MNKLQVRFNINFLENPLFMTSNTLAKFNMYDDMQGYALLRTEKTGADIQGNITEIKLRFNTPQLPQLIDIKYLSYLLATAQNLGTNTIRFSSFYKIAKDMGISPNGPLNLKRFEESLKRWNQTLLVFEKNVLYKNGGRSVEGTSFPVIYNYVCKQQENGAYDVEVTFNNNFIEANKDKYSRLLSVEGFNQFESPFAARLYHVLCKHLDYNSGEWNIGIDKLLKKLGRYFQDNYQLVQIMKKSIDEINNIFQKNITFTLKNEIFYFTAPKTRQHIEKKTP